MSYTKFCRRKDCDVKWYLMDAKGKVLGRLASEIAKILSGKHRIEYTPNADLGDHVIVVNAELVAVTGRKSIQKEYISHSGFIGGLKRVPYERVMEKHPDRILRYAVYRMMPKTILGRLMRKKLHIFVGDKPDMQAQKPVALPI